MKHESSAKSRDDDICKLFIRNTIRCNVPNYFYCHQVPFGPRFIRFHFYLITFSISIWMNEIKLLEICRIYLFYSINKQEIIQHRTQKIFVNLGGNLVNLQIIECISSAASIRTEWQQQKIVHKISSDEHSSALKNFPFSLSFNFILIWFDRIQWWLKRYFQFFFPSLILASRINKEIPVVNFNNKNNAKRIEKRVSNIWSSLNEWKLTRNCNSAVTLYSCINRFFFCFQSKATRLEREKKNCVKTENQPLGSIIFHKDE